MKRSIAILLILSIFMLIGCTDTQEEYMEPVNFYFPRINPGYGQADSLIHAEVWEGRNYNTVAMLDLYFHGPKDPESRNFFPAGTRITSVGFGDNTLIINVSDEFAALSGIELYVACACIYATGSELFDLDIVEIKAATALLDGKTSIIMDESTHLLQDVIVTPAPTGGTE